MTNKLFAFGCSYATGEELLMHHLDDVDQYRIKTASDPRKFFSMLDKDPNLILKYNDIKIEQKKISWPNILSNLLELECVNLAESGNSLDKIVWQIYQEYHSKNIKDNDIVIVSLTKSTSNLYFSDTPESFQLPSLLWPINDRLLGVKDNGDVGYVIDKDSDKAILNWFNNDRIAWDFIKNLIILKNLQNSIKLYIVPAMNDNPITNLKCYNQDLFSKMYSDLKTLLLTNTGLDDFSKTYHAWGHPDKEAHKKYAEHLYEILRKL